MQRHSDFISQHINDDPRDLALRQSRYPDVDIPYVVQQISAFQTARKKLPLWASTTGIEYPVHLSMEQCSSQLTAEYKASILPQLSQVTDLTAGFGVDATMLGLKAEHLTYVERNDELCRIARNNLPLLGVNNFEVVNGDAEEYLTSPITPQPSTLNPHPSLLFLDPARRDSNGSKTVQISDCTPDVTLLQDQLLQKADLVMVKLSPMLDIPIILNTLKCVREIHVVSVDNECKELLVLMSHNAGEVSHNVGEMSHNATEPTIHCVNITRTTTQHFIASVNDRQAQCHYTDPSTLLPQPSSINHKPSTINHKPSTINHKPSTINPQHYLYEPNVSILKAACFRTLAQTYHIDKLHPSSHLYTSSELIPDFPGRIFRIEQVYSLKDKALKQIKKANLTVRNFPSTVAELRKRLKLSEGGTTYLFATTLSDESKVMIRAEKVLSQ